MSKAVYQTNFKKYHKAVEYLESMIKLPQKYNYMKREGKPEVYLKRTQSFLDIIGNPEKSFQYVHVSGTSGKGSVSSMIASALSKSGKKTGLVVSPFSVTTIEKISVDGLYISPDDFAQIVEELKPKIDQIYLNGKYGRPSYFEILLAISLIYFKKQKCQWVVLEVGCGGRYDYTNIIPQSKKRIATITNIDKDHLHIIGPTLKDVAYEKAGIIKKGCDFFTTERRPELLQIFKNECKKVGANYHQIERANLYQVTNHNLASAILKKIGVDDMPESKVNLPCRFEHIQKNPNVILDGAHNLAKIEAFVARYKKDFGKCIIVFGASETKDALKMLNALLLIASEFILTRTVSGPHTPFSPQVLHRHLKKSGKKSRILLDPYQALDVALKTASKNSKKQNVVVTGSFFLTGDLRQIWYPEEYILKNRKSF